MHWPWGHLRLLMLPRLWWVLLRSPVLLKVLLLSQSRVAENPLVGAIIAAEPSSMLSPHNRVHEHLLHPPPSLPNPSNHHHCRCTSPEKKSMWQRRHYSAASPLRSSSDLEKTLNRTVVSPSLFPPTFPHPSSPFLAGISAAVLPFPPGPICFFPNLSRGATASFKDLCVILGFQI